MPELAALDLNLLVAFEALHSERSVTRAGRRLGLSQPATSGALARLREMLGDELFVRGKDGLVPTERCEELAAPIAKALSDLRTALGGGAFDPATTTRTFSIGGVDAALGVLAPLDLAFAPIASVPANVGAKELFEVGGLLAMRPDHPLAHRRKTRAAGLAKRGAGLPKHGLATLDDLTRYPQVMVSFVGSSKSQIDEALARGGKKRHVAFVLTSFLAVPHVLAETDALAILPSPFAKALEAKGLIATAPLPEGVAFPALRMRMLWPLAQDASPASRWLRELVARVAKRVVR